MKRFILYGLFCLGWCGFSLTFQADPVLFTYNYTLINVPGSTSTTALGLNNAGQIVGSYSDATGAHGFLDTNNVFTTLPFLHAGQLVVTATFGFGNPNAYVYQNGTYTAISQNTQNGVGINNVGEIVTASIPAVGVFQNGVLAGYFFPPYAGPYDLNDSGQLLFATALATPTATAIPEPDLLLLLSGGLTTLGLLQRRRQSSGVGSPHR